MEPVRRRALPFKAEGVLDPGHARAADDGRGAGAFRDRIAAHTAPARRAARAPKASQPQGQTLNGTVRTMLGAAAGGALRLCRARKHGLGTPTRTARTAPNASRLARAQSLPTIRPDAKRNGAHHVGRGCPRCAGAVLCRARTDTARPLGWGVTAGSGAATAHATRAAVVQVHNPEAYASGLADEMAESPAMGDSDAVLSDCEGAGSESVGMSGEHGEDGEGGHSNASTGSEARGGRGSMAGTGVEGSRARRSTRSLEWRSLFV